MKHNLGLALTVFAIYAALAPAPTAVQADPKPSEGRVKSRPPAVGDEAQDFELDSLAGESVKLSDLAKDGPVVLVVLRGYPGYQCPLCTAQVAQLVGEAEAFQKAGATVLMIYPGPAKGLNEHLAEFARGKKLPANFLLLLDPDYDFAKTYRLRWDAQGETAYPSTFVIDAHRKILFAKISKTHGDRALMANILKSIPRK